MAIKIVGTTSGIEVDSDATSKALRVALYNSLGREVNLNSKPTFAVSNTFTPAATPTDLVTIFGSASKTIRVIKFEIITTNTAAGSQTYSLIKRSAVNTTGTFVAGTVVSLDSTDGISSTATNVGHYTANASALGAAIGTLITKRVASPVLVPGSFAGVMPDAGIDLIASLVSNGLNKPITLSGTGQGLCLNFGGAALVAGQVHAYNIVWTEE